MKTDISYIVEDLISQIQLAYTIKQRGFIGVFTARQNLLPVIDLLLSQAKIHFGSTANTLSELESFIEQRYKVRFSIYQKPEPFKEKNHLTLTVGGYTAIIFDYEESVYE